MKLMDIYESFFGDDEDFNYSDPYISATLRLVDDDVEILDWNSTGKVKGGTKKSLQLLKKKYGGEIRAVDCGYPHEPQFKYWVHMLELGLIDGFYDDDTNYYDKSNPPH